MRAGYDCRVSTTSPLTEQHRATEDAGPDPGQRPLGLGIGIATLVGILLLPWLIVPLFYLAANVIAIATGSDFSSDTVNVPALMIALVAVVTLLVLGVAAMAGTIGRSLTARRRQGA